MISFSPKRRLIIGATAAIAVGWFGLRQLPKKNNAAKQKIGKTARPANDILASIVDTMIPRDEFAGALDLGLETTLANRIKTDSTLRSAVALISESAQKLSLSQLRIDFVAASQAQREALLNSILEANRNTPLKKSLNLLRKFLLQAFYSSAEGRASIAYLLPSEYPAYRLGQ